MPETRVTVVSPNATHVFLVTSEPHAVDLTDIVFTDLATAFEFTQNSVGRPQVQESYAVASSRYPQDFTLISFAIRNFCLHRPNSIAIALLTYSYHPEFPAWTPNLSGTLPSLFPIRWSRP
jgi:hypothetical protein